MEKHTISGRWKLGFGLSLVAATFWGVLPIALKILLGGMDPYTITWYRFTVAALLLGLFVFKKHRTGWLKQLRGRILGLLFIAAIGVGGNYILFLLGLNFLTPSTAQIVIQLAPMFLILGSLIVFRESFCGLQWLGVAVFLIGMALFFNQRLDELLYRLTGYTAGVFLIVAASLAWAIYALAQKQLLGIFPSETIIFFLFIVGVVLLLPVARPSRLQLLNRTHLILLVFCALNTLIAYGSFAEALDHWEASRVSAVLTTVPLLTVVAMKYGTVLFPDFIEPEYLNPLSIVGAVFVVIGSMMAALGRRRGSSEIKKVAYNISE